MMADETPTTPTGNDAPAAGARAETPQTAEPAPTPPPAGPTAQELAEVKDKLLRALAEVENIRRRAEREVADARQYAVTGFAREMLSVADNLRRAIEAVPAEQRQAGEGTLRALIEGVEVTERGLEQTLARFGVRRMEAKGKKFDPSFHQAMYEVERDDAAPGTVVEEMQAGYTIGERVLKPALVAIAKKAAKAANNNARPAEAKPTEAKPADAEPADAAKAEPPTGTG
jgi:molecular chaperone GrpE